MSTSELDTGGISGIGEQHLPPTAGSSAPVENHRLRAVRQEQGLSLRRVAQMLGCDIEVVRREEEGHAELTLSRLYQWQSVLEVPIADLLVDSGAPLSTPVLQRARLLKLMKSVAAILQRTRDAGTRRLAEGMSQQLKEIMPELDGVTPWHAVSDRRPVGRLGRVVQQVYSFDLRPEDPRHRQ